MNNFKDEDIKLFNQYCKKHKYYPAILPAKRRIIAIGDLHGDFNLTIKTLQLAKVIDNNNNWIGNDTFVVQVGDQLDSKRPSSLYNNHNHNHNQNHAYDVKILTFMTDLNLQANKVDGGVISLLGNHEVMNVLGNMTYVSDGDIESFKHYDIKNKQSLSPLEKRKHLFSPGNKFANLMACTRLPVIIIGSFIFLHAGLITEFMEVANIKDRNDMFKINYLIKKWLLGLIDKNNVINIIISSKYSIFWDRILGGIPPNMNKSHPKCIDNLDKVFETLHLSGMIIGHTPQAFIHNSGINKTCGDKLWRIDFGGSFGFDKFDNNNIKQKQRQVQVLEILNNNQINILE